MTTAQTDRWNAVTGRILIGISLTCAGSIFLGSQVASAISKSRSFYSYALVWWAIFVAFWLFRLIRELWNLSHSRFLAEPVITKSSARQLIAYILCLVLISSCLIICVGAAKPFGTLYMVTAVVGWGTIVFLMFLATKRKLEQMSPIFSNN